jgi:hypothetical protein
MKKQQAKPRQLRECEKKARTKSYRAPEYEETRNLFISTSRGLLAVPVRN